MPRRVGGRAVSRARLSRYRSRRDFRRSPEPRGREHGLRKDRNPIFVIQQHRSSHLHWDLRLEVDGVLRSWAIPHGPSTDPREKRLAVATEDHPLEYADFEGVIPPGEYGAGTVIVWDAGPYRTLADGDESEAPDIADALAGGKALFWLEGRKIRGGYALVHARVGGDPDHWLLVKMKDEGADARRNPTRTEPESVISGRTLDDVEQDDDG